MFRTHDDLSLWRFLLFSWGFTSPLRFSWAAAALPVQIVRPFRPSVRKHGAPTYGKEVGEAVDFKTASL